MTLSDMFAGCYYFRGAAAVVVDILSVIEIVRELGR